MTMLMPWAVVANYNKSGAIFDLTFPQAPPAERTGRPAPLVDIATLWRDGERRLGKPIDFIAVSNPGDAAARVTMSASNRAVLSIYTPAITHDGTTGRVIWASPPAGGAQVTAGAMIGLHAGRFGDHAMRWLSFLCGVGGSLMVASGLVLWTVKHREKLPDPARPHVGFRLVERLNIAVVGGYPLAIAGFFWANRLLLPGMAARADAEINAMFLLWGAVLVFAFVRKPARVWAALLGLTGALLVALPVFDMIATPKGLPGTIASGDRFWPGPI